MRSDTRRRILNYIEQFLDERGYAPTVRDIMKGCKVSTTSVVQHHLNQLEKEGFIQRDPNVFRSIRLVKRGSDIEFQIPILGTIAAGEPIPVPFSDTWVNELLGTVKIPSDLLRGKREVFALKIKGNSMIDALISDGDTVLIEPVKAVNDGDMVAVWLKDRQEVTLKKIYRENNLIRLQPANVTMMPLYVSPENVEVQGRVVGVIRVL